MVAATTFSCSYDDDDLWKKVDDLDSRLEAVEGQLSRMNSDVQAMKVIVDALGDGGFITDVQETTDGWKIVMSDGTSFAVKNGTKGADAPVIGVKQHTDGVYYWTITVGGTEKWLPDNDTPQLRVSGHTPVLDVDDEGYWTVDGKRIAAPEGGYVEATGKDGDSFFESVDTSSANVIVFTLQNGTTFTLPKGNSFMYFVSSTGTAPIRFSSTKKFDLVLKDIEFIEVLSVPQGWTATVNIEDAQVAVTVPTGAAREEGIVSLIGLDSKGNTLMAARRMKIVDYTYADGIFLVNEGNMGTQDGTIIWYDTDLAEYRDIYQEANGGKSPGNVLQDMFMANGKVYLVSQNGSTLGGEGQLVICDARTMVMEKSYDNLDFDRHAGDPGCPQHIVVVDDKVFIQYVDYAYESNSGIRVFDLATETLRPDDIEGTYGAFGTVGALKAKMLYSKGQIIAGLAKAVVFIDPATEAVTKRIDFTGGVKDVVKGADGNLYIAVSGDFETPQGYYDPSPAGSKIYAYTQSGELIGSTAVTEVSFNTSTAYPNIGMSASFTEPYLYFNPDKDMMASDFTSRFNYSTGTLDNIYVRPQQYSYVYGYTGAHPTKDLLFVAGNPNYAWSRLTVYDTSEPSSPSVILDTNREYRDYTASPAGVYFTYSFSSEYINK